ncbi:MAG: twin-arginine translocation signal domain-containing protein, partial [Tannerella sp.]|nr:twin-arginine translocation signal domain-containing protein [Tannerella sp.]
MKENFINRRTFLKSSAMVGAAGMVGTGSVMTSCGAGGEAKEGQITYTPIKEAGTYYVPELPDLATDGKPLKAGVIGCGGRGSGAA